MEYIRYSSQPATVDLVRADLGEVWTITDSGAQDANRAPSVSGVSDMLDLEFLPTPAHRSSKSRKKDPLEDILGDVLELSPSPKAKTSGLSNDLALPEEQFQGPECTDRLSDPVAQSPSPPGIQRLPRSTRKSERPSNNADKRKHPDQPTPSTELSADSPSPKSRRLRQSNQKAVAPATRKGPAKTSKPPKTNTKAAKSVSSRTKTDRKNRKEDDDLFELSDWTDKEEKARPKKRQRKQPPPKQPPVSSTPGNQANEADTRPVSHRAKPSRVPKKPPRDVLPQENPVEEAAKYPDATSHAKDAESMSDPRQHGLQRTAIASSDPDGRPVVDQEERATEKHSIPIASDDPAEPLLKATGQTRRGSAVPEEVRVTAIASSVSPEADDAVAMSTSPMFVDPEPRHPATSIVPAVTELARAENSDEQSVVRRHTGRRHLSCTTPPSFQRHATGNGPRSTRPHQAEHQLPEDIRNAFFDEQPAAATSPSPALVPDLYSGDGGLDPAEIWKQVVHDDSPPAILHRIVNLLHRSLKPREEVIRDIAADYRENALRLLQNLCARHDQEKGNILAAVRKASRISLSIFADAGQDLAAHISSIQDMDITHTTNMLTRPVLAQKLDAVAKLCQARLSSYGRSNMLGDDAPSETEDLDGLENTYRLRLVNAAQQPNDQSQDASGTVNSQVDEFIRRCLHGKTRDVRSVEPREPTRPARNADEALEVLLDGIIDALKENSEEGSGRTARDGAHVVSGLSEGSDGADMVCVD